MPKKKRSNDSESKMKETNLSHEGDIATGCVKRQQRSVTPPLSTPERLYKTLLAGSSPERHSTKSRRIESDKERDEDKSPVRWSAPLDIRPSVDSLYMSPNTSSSTRTGRNGIAGNKIQDSDTCNPYDYDNTLTPAAALYSSCALFPENGIRGDTSSLEKSRRRRRALPDLGATVFEDTLTEFIGQEKNCSDICTGPHDGSPPQQPQCGENSMNQHSLRRSVLVGTDGRVNVSLSTQQLFPPPIWERQKVVMVSKEIKKHVEEVEVEEEEDIARFSNASMPDLASSSLPHELEEVTGTLQSSIVSAEKEGGITTTKRSSLEPNSPKRRSLTSPSLWTKSSEEKVAIDHPLLRLTQTLKSNVRVSEGDSITLGMRTPLRGSVLYDSGSHSSYLHENGKEPPLISPGHTLGSSNEQEERPHKGHRMRNSLLDAVDPRIVENELGSDSGTPISKRERESREDYVTPSNSISSRASSMLWSLSLPLDRTPSLHYKMAQTALAEEFYALPPSAPFQSPEKRLNKGKKKV